VRKKLNKKLTLRIETLRHLSSLSYVHGGTLNTRADTCTEPETGTCTYATNELACGSADTSGYLGCNSAYPVCVSNNC
jgi:hypothetical protein